MYVSRAVGRILGFVRERFPSAVGQSSWGPTGFAFVPSQAIADEAIAALRARQCMEPGIRLMAVRARNRGARISATPAHGGA
jgi:predicted sugar kinase